MRAHQSVPDQLYFVFPSLRLTINATVVRPSCEAMMLADMILIVSIAFVVWWVLEVDEISIRGGTM